MPFDIEEEDELLNPDNRRKRHVPGGIPTSGMINVFLDLNEFRTKLGINHRMTVEKEAEIAKRGIKKDSSSVRRSPPKLNNKKKK